MFLHVFELSDGACFPTEGVIGLGAVIRDASSQVHGALAQRIKISCSAITMEALACHRAMIFAKDEGVMDCIFEGDAKNIIKAILASYSSHPEYGIVISDILKLAGVFSFCNFSHVKRLGNSIAHFLARYSKSRCELQVW